MNLIHPLLLVFTLASCNAGYYSRCKKICVLDDMKCVSRGGSLTYNAVVNGTNGVVKPMDPLKIKKIEKNRGSAKYVLTDITVKGLKNCKVTQLTLNVTSAVYKQYLYCPKLIYIFHYEFKSSTGPVDYDERGTARVTVYNYKILNKGNYGVQVRGKDHNPQFFVLTHSLKTKLKGNMIFKLKSDCKGDKRKCEKSKAQNNKKYMQQYWVDTEDPIIKKAMKILVKGIDTYCRALTMGDILPECIKNQS